MCNKNVTSLIPTLRIGTHKVNHVESLIAKRHEQIRLKKEKIEKRKQQEKGNTETSQIEMDGKKNGVPFNGPKSLDKYFKDNDVFAFLEGIRWKNGIYCPHCKFEKSWKIKTNKHQYKCAGCLKQFNVATGSMFGNRKMPLIDMLLAIMYENLTPDSLTSRELSRYMEFSRKTAFETLMSIRKIGYQQSMFSLGVIPEGLDRIIVEIDIVVMDDGANHNRHIDKKKDGDNIYRDKVKVLTMKVRGGNVLAFEIPDMKVKTVLSTILKYLPKNVDIICTDEGRQFKKLKEYFPGKHYSVNHSKRHSVYGYYHTQTVERFHTDLQIPFWKFRKRVTKENKIFYINSTVFKHNTSKLNEYEKLILVIENIFKFAESETVIKPMYETLSIAA